MGPIVIILICLCNNREFSFLELKSSGFCAMSARKYTGRLCTRRTIALLSNSPSGVWRLNLPDFINMPCSFSYLCVLVSLRRWNHSHETLILGRIPKRREKRLKVYKKSYERMGKDVMRKTCEVHWLCWCEFIESNTYRTSAFCALYNSRNWRNV